MEPAWQARETEREREGEILKRRGGEILKRDRARGTGRRRNSAVHMKRDTEQDMEGVIGETL